MEEFMLGIVWLGFFAACFFAWFYYLQARTKERTLLIEKGADASNFYAKKPERRGFRFRFPWLKLGFLMVGVSFGFMVALITMRVWAHLFGSMEEPLLFGSIFLFGGLGMIAAHFVDRKKENKAL